MPSESDDDLYPEANEPVEIPIEDFLDLHSFLPKDVKAVVEEYLFQCHLKGFREVRIIHGRGRGIQRQIVQALLKSNPLVASFGDAPPEMGGWGATLVQLNKKAE